MEKNFADLGLSEAALRAVERLGYETPTPVQIAAIPLALQGRDLIAAASTGTGKTAAFLLPTMDKLSGTKKSGRKPRILVVSPTRELAQQIARACMQIAKETNQYVTTVFGGSPYGPQIKDLKRGTDILIATPGRLNDLIDRGSAKLGDVEVLILDEADRMLDMGFLPAMETIIRETPDSRQTLLFSATIDESITKGIGSLLNNPAVVEIAHKGETAKTVKQFIMPIAHRDKYALLRAVLDEKGSDRVIVFARTKNRTEECVEMLRDNGFSAESIHSDRSQIQRRKALENFRRGRTSILVATDVLARGIDVPDVDHVINIDLPDCPEDYVHRIGRTGRAGEEGFAISFVTRETRGTLREIEKLTNSSIPFMKLESYETDPSLLDKAKRGNRSPSQSNGRKRSEGSYSDRKRNGSTSGSGSKYGKNPSSSNGSKYKKADRPAGESPYKKSEGASSDPRSRKSEKPAGGSSYKKGGKPSGNFDRRKNEGPSEGSNRRKAAAPSGEHAKKSPSKGMRGQSTYDYSRFSK
jgi:ATP-dependent RNA helicase RhlE